MILRMRKFFLITFYLCHFLLGNGSISFAQETKLDTLLIEKRAAIKDSRYQKASEVLIKIGDIYEREEKFILAQASYLESLTLQEIYGGTDALRVKTLWYIGIILSSQEFHRNGIEYNLKALSLAEQLSDSGSIGKIKNSLGVDYNALNITDTAIVMLEEALKIKEQLDFSEGSIANTLHNLGWAYEKKGEFTKSLDLLRKAESIREHLEDTSGLVDSYNAIGYTFLRQGTYDSAELLLLNAKELAEDKKMDRLANYIYSNLDELYFKMGNRLRAYQFLKMHDTLRERIRDERIVTAGQESLTKHESDKKDRTIDHQDDLISTYSYVIIILVLFALLIALYFYQRQKLLRQEQTNEKVLFDQQVDRLMREGEMNTINAMMSGKEKERVRIAEDLHDRLGSMLAGLKLHFNAARSKSEIPKSLEIADTLLNQTIDETRKIAHNLASGVLSKFGLVAALEDLKNTIQASNQLGFEIDTFNLKDRLSADLEVDLYRIVQELVSNTLKHAEAQNVTIQLTRHEDQLLTLMIEDDGRGFDLSDRSDGLGLRNVQNRIKKHKGEVNIDSNPGRGTTITFEVPINGSEDGED